MYMTRSNNEFSFPFKYRRARETPQRWIAECERASDRCIRSRSPLAVYIRLGIRSLRYPDCQDKIRTAYYIVVCLAVSERDREPFHWGDRRESYVLRGVERSR